MWKHQTVKWNNKYYYLTRLGFGLNCAPKIMTSILNKVLSLDDDVRSGTDAYMDDIIVNCDLVSPSRVMDHLAQYGLVSKQPEMINGARALGLQIRENKLGQLMWSRGNDLPIVPESVTRRELFSVCGMLTGHYPVAGWLRIACSFVKRHSDGSRWDDLIGDTACAMLRDIILKVEHQDPVRGAWCVSSARSCDLWCESFHTSNKIVIYPKLKINNFTIDRVTDFKFLGLIISSNLKWNKHSDHISIKVSKVIGIMFRLKSIVPSDVLHTLYNSLIMPHFHYCLLTWGSTIRNGHKLHLLQKKALRLVDNSHYIAHTDPIFKKLHMVKIIDMFNIAVWKFYYKLMNDLLPPYFNYMKPNVPVICDHYNVRNPKFHLPVIKHDFAKQLIQYCLIKLLNEDDNISKIADKVFEQTFCTFTMTNVLTRIIVSHARERI